MAMLGCRRVGIDEPKAPEFRKNMIAFVKIDRCATDAIESVTGAGKRFATAKNFRPETKPCPVYVVERVIFTTCRRELAAITSIFFKEPLP